MELYLEDDNRAFNEIYSRYQSNVYTYLRKRVHDEVLVNDIFQNCFIKFHKSRDQYDASYPLLKWIYTITRSVMLDELKKRKVEKTEYLDSFNYSEEMNEGQAIVDIDSEKSLTDNEKDALRLKYYFDKDYTEISRILESSQSNARKLISRGLKKLRTKYARGQE